MSEHPSTAPRASRFARHREMVTAVVSFFVGALALATSTYNVYLQRQQVRAQVLPRLDVATNFGTEGLEVVVTNRGVGPAMVKRLRVSVDGKRTTDWTEAVVRMLRRNRLDDEMGIHSLEGTVMSPGLEVSALKMRSFTNSVAFLRERRRLDVEICYCSTLDDCWTVEAPGSGVSVTRDVLRCDPDAKPFESLDEHTLDEMLDLIAKGDGGARLTTDAGPP